MERRRTDRKRTILGAQIAFDGGSVSVDCLVRNLSDLGALVEVTPNVPLPKLFEIKVPKTKATYEAHLRWRHEDLVGVEFKKASETGDHGLQGSEPADRAGLEAEIRRLRAKLASMQRTAESYGVAYLFKDEVG